jgi:hypothetical protein
MEPLVNDPMTKVSKDVLERMLSELPTYDEYHLVYALELGGAHSPETFALHVPQYLAHEEASVCCTAFRVLSKLPEEYITQDLVDSVRKIVSSYPVRKFVAEILDMLTKRMRAKQSQ